MARMTQTYDLKDRCIEFHHCNNVMNISHFVRDGLTRLLYTLQQSQLCYNLECQPQAINYTVSTLYVAAVLVYTNLMGFFCLRQMLGFSLSPFLFMQP